MKSLHERTTPTVEGTDTCDASSHPNVATKSRHLALASGQAAVAGTETQDQPRPFAVDTRGDGSFQLGEQVYQNGGQPKGENGDLGEWSKSKTNSAGLPDSASEQRQE